MQKIDEKRKERKRIKTMKKKERKESSQTYPERFKIMRGREGFKRIMKC